MNIPLVAYPTQASRPKIQFVSRLKSSLLNLILKFSWLRLHGAANSRSHLQNAQHASDQVQNHVPDRPPFRALPPEVQPHLRAVLSKSHPQLEASDRFTRLSKASSGFNKCWRIRILALLVTLQSTLCFSMYFFPLPSCTSTALPKKTTKSMRVSMLQWHAEFKGQTSSQHLHREVTTRWIGSWTSDTGTGKCPPRHLSAVTVTKLSTIRQPKR